MLRRFLACLIAFSLLAAVPASATVNSSTNKTIAIGTGSQTQFSFNFIGVAAAYISVLYTDPSGNQTLLAQGTGATQYQIALNAPVQGAIWGLGGTVTYNPNGTPIPAGSTLTIFRILPLTQAITLQNLPSIATLGKGSETGLDLGVMQGQQISEQSSRSIVANIANSTPPAPLPPAAQIAGLYICADGTGNNLVACTQPSGGGVISTAMAPVVAAATLGLGRTAFGLGNTAVENIGAALQDDGGGNIRVTFPVVADTVNQTVDSTFHLKVRAATGPITYSLDRANSLWNGFGFWVYAYTGSITLTPDSNDSFIGQASGTNYTLPPGSQAYFTTNGNSSGTWYIFLTSPFFTTGDAKLSIKATPDAGWVLNDGGTIGSASSGASNRANADTLALYSLIWNNINNTYAPVVGGRGSTPLADFTANKAIQLPAQNGPAFAIGAGPTAALLWNMEIKL